MSDINAQSLPVSMFIGIIILTSAWQTFKCFGCIDGLWGKTCTKQCPANCVTCTQDSVDSGLPCTSCVPGKYSDRYIGFSLSYHNDDCQIDCSGSCVSCTSHDNCTECVSGRYGTECQYNCYSGCEDGQCDKMDGKCTCITGYTSRFCIGQPSCANNPCACCKNNKCETNNGNYCTDGCIDGVRGDTCDNECPPDCLTCIQDSVDSRRPCTSCVPGKYSGNHIDIIFFQYYDDCRFDCTYGCVSCASYNNCTECVDGRFGTACQYDCYSGCEGGQCDKMDGKCTCRTGYASRYCRCPASCAACNVNNKCTECDNGLYGTACQHSCYSGCEGGQCDKVDGKCVCKTGYASHFCKGQALCTYIPCACCKNNKCETNNNNYCIDGCIHGMWGESCGKACPPECVACTQDSGHSGRPCTSCVPGKYSGRFHDFSSSVYFDNCRHDCRDSCVSCASYNNCTECVDGRYGTACQYSCYSGCEDGACNKMDGQCTCTTGSASRFCISQKSCTNHPCACCKNNNCDTNNGSYCIDGCIDGVRGDKCNNECPPDCLTCTLGREDKPCTSCVQGKYIGKNGDQSNNPYYDNCNLACRDTCESCTSYRNCTKCVDGRYGTECQYSCYSGCEGSQCGKIDGKCTCKTGYASRFCKDQPPCTNNTCACCKNNTCEKKNDNFCKEGCIDGIWGDACDNNCDDNCETCTQGSEDSGRLCTACVRGKYIGPRSICHVCRSECVACTAYDNCTNCVKDRYGTDCHYACSTGCEGGICNNTDGSCSCVNGRYGRLCDANCSTGCEGGICNNTDGSCSCVNGRYGRLCDAYCSTGCESGICNKTDGSCSCVNGRYGKQCNNNITAVSNDDGDFPGATIGGAIGGSGVVVLIIAGIVVFFIKRRNHRPQCCSVITNDETQGPGEIQLVAVNAVDNETCDVHIGGSIYYNTKKVLGCGSYGVVYEGRSGLHKNKPVAVKKVECSSDHDAKDLLNINKEIRALETLDTTAENTHIIHFIDSYIYKNTVYLAFELAIGTLVDFVSPSHASDWQLSLTNDDVIRGIVSGLNYTHNKNIVHRDLKPGNIFIVDHSVSGLKAVIGDFGQAKSITGNTLSLAGNTGSNGYIAPEVWMAMLDSETVSLGTKCNKASDIFSLGLVIHYTKSFGNHPFGINNYAAQDSISKGNSPTFHHIANRLDTFPYEDMLQKMLNKNPNDRPSIQVVSEHPALWTSDQIIKYFGLKSDEFESRIRAGTSNINLLEDPNLIPNGNWMNRLPGNMGTYLRSYKLPNRASPLYKGKEKEVRFLLRAIRNTNGHYQVYPQNTQTEMGCYPEGHVSLWLTVCPGLLMHVYNKL